MGYPDPPKRTAHGFECCDTGYLKLLEERKIANRDAILASHQPAVIRFWYRQHVVENWTDPNSGIIDYDSPPNTEPGMIRMAVDAKGRMVSLEVRPTQTEGRVDPDWKALFTAAGLDPARFSTAEPRELPPMSNDARMAWTGTYGDGRPEHIRAEAAFWLGRPVYFRISGYWSGQQFGAGAIGFSRPAPVELVAGILLVLLLAGTVIVAWRNLLLGRGDRPGAAKLAGAAFLSFMAAWLFSGTHVASFEEFVVFVRQAGQGLFVAGVIWSLYLSVEPYIRRHWPDALISWTRLLAGRVRDRLVASHVLTGVSLVFILSVPASLRYWLGSSLSSPLFVDPLNSPSNSLATLINIMGEALDYVCVVLLAVSLLRMLLRRMWIADLVGCILVSVLLSSGAANIYLSRGRSSRVFCRIRLCASLAPTTLRTSCCAGRRPGDLHRRQPTVGHVVWKPHSIVLRRDYRRRGVGAVGDSLG